VAAPAAPTQPAGPQLALAPVPRPDLRAAASAALSAAPCGLLSSRVTESSLEIQGVLPQAEETRLRGRLAESALPAGAARLQLGLFDGPFCTLFPELRPALAEPDAAPLLAVDGTMPLRKGQLLRLSVQLPPWANNLHVAYATSDGQVVRLEPGAAQTPGARVRLGDPRPGFPGWEIDEPFGTDLLLAVVSEGALFPPDAPIMLSQAAYAEGFAAALRSARVSGRRVALRPLVVDTVAK
jgi:serine/threonine-protein kinase